MLHMAGSLQVHVFNQITNLKPLLRERRRLRIFGFKLQIPYGMAMEISLDLINQLKVSFRREANLSSFDPVGDYSGSSFPGLPTVAEAIAELDASSHDFRCGNCKGKLLRGIDSLICVFCGKQQRTSDNPPDPIKFTSTSGYKWFLSSLNLDGSEMVEPLKEANSSSRGATAPVVKGIAVSKFLDLEIQWSANEDNSVNSGPDDGLQNKNPLNLGGVSVDDFFVEERGNIPKVDPAERKPVEDDFKDPRSLSLFDSVKSGGAVESQQNENIGLFKGKDAQQNTSSEEPENLSLFSGRDEQDSVSVAEQGNFGFFEGKDSQHSFKEDENLNLFEGRDTQRTISSKNDGSFAFFEDKDAQRNGSSKEDENFALFESKEAQRNSSSKEDENLGLFESKEAQRNSSSKEDPNLGLFEGAPSSNAGLESFEDKVVASSSDWDSEFQSADHKPSQDKISGDPFLSSPVDLSAHMDSLFGSGKDLLYEKPADSSTAYVSKAGDWLQDDFFGNATGKTQDNESAVHDNNEGDVVGGSGSPSMDIDWIGDDLWQTSVKKPAENTATDANDVDDDWNDFATSANSKTHNNTLSQTMESSQENIFDGLAHVTNEDKRQNPDTSMMPDIVNGQEDDIFGDWDIFPSSTVLQTPLQTPNNHVNPSSEQNLEKNLFGETSNHPVLDSDLSSESIGGLTNSVKAMPSGSSTLERPSDPTGKDQTHDLEGTTSTSTKSKTDVAEELMSQMHDLSFMLETELSVPPISKTE